MGKRILFISFLILYLSGNIEAQNKISIDSFINENIAKKIVYTLSNDSLLGRLTGTKQNLFAANYIINELKQAGIKPLFNNFLVPFNYKYHDTINTGDNIIGIISGKTKSSKIIIFSAHYDHLGTISTNPYSNYISNSYTTKDTIYNGANDDASGVSAVLMLAKYFKALNNNERSIMFILFSGEELGLIGSEYFVKTIKTKNIIADINIEMIGRSENKDYHPYITGTEKSNVKKILNTTLSEINREKYGLHFFKNDPYIEEQLYQRSDNYSFAKCGIIAHSIMLTSPQDKHRI